MRLNEDQTPVPAADDEPFNLDEFEDDEDDAGDDPADAGDDADDAGDDAGDDADPAADDAPVAPAADDDSPLGKIVAKLSSTAEPLDEKLLERFSEDGFEGIDPVAKTLVLQVSAKLNAEMARVRAEGAAEKKQLEDVRAELAKQVRAFRAEKAAFARTLRNPDLDRNIREGLSIKDDEIDPYTEAGRLALAKREVAQTFDKFRSPILADSEKEIRKARLQDFFDKNPDAREPAFLADMKKLIAERRQAGNPMKIDDAYLVIRGERAAKAEAERLRQRRAARARSRGAVNGAGRGGADALSGNDLVNKYREIGRTGYRGLDGSAAQVKWLEDNPKAWDALDAL